MSTPKEVLLARAISCFDRALLEARADDVTVNIGKMVEQIEQGIALVMEAVER